MKNNINNKKLYKSMNKKVFLMFLILFLFISVSYSQNQEPLFIYQMDEGSGFVVFDSSGNGFNSVGVGTGYYAPAKWGIYSLDFNGVNDYMLTATTFQPYNKTSLSFWMNPDSNVADRDIINMYDTSTNVYFSLFLSESLPNDQLYFYYLDDNLTEQSVILEGSNFPSGAWQHIALNLDFNTGLVTYYRNGVMRYNDTPSPAIYLNTSRNVNLRAGTKFDLSYDYDGKIDALYLFNFTLSNSQVNTLYTTNTINYILDEEGEEVQLNLSDIIDDYNIQVNDTVNNPVEIIVHNSAPANCELYINNQLVNYYNNIWSFSYQDILEYGENTYFVYCYYDYNGTRYYDNTNIINFYVEPLNKAIEFYLYDENNNLVVQYDDLYLSTPCPTKEEIYEYFYTNNPREFYIKNVIDGMTSFNLTYSANYDFCILKGKINFYDNDSYTTNYNFQEVDKITELGTLFVTNETYTYSIKLENTDVYKPTDPNFWGKTWESLFQLIISVILGGALIFLGLQSKNDKLMVVGGLIIFIGMGASVITIAGLLF